MVYNQLARSTQLGHPSVGKFDEYQQKLQSRQLTSMLHDTLSLDLCATEIQLVAFLSAI